MLPTTVETAKDSEQLLPTHHAIAMALRPTAAGGDTTQLILVLPKLKHLTSVHAADTTQLHQSTQQQTLQTPTAHSQLTA